MLPSFRLPLRLVVPWSLVSVVAIVAAAPVVSQDGAMFRGNLAHTGVYPGASLASSLTVKWRFRTAGRIYSSPAVTGGVAYVGSTDGYLYAVQAATGQETWKFKTDGRVTSSPAVSGGVVYFGSYDGFFYAVDAATGTIKWKFATGGERRFTATHLHGAVPRAEAVPDFWDVYLSSPAVAHGVVYFGSGDGNVYALDAMNGALKWKFHTDDVVHASPAIADNTVFIGSWDSYFYALDATTGALKWRFKTGEDPDIHNQVGISSSAAVVDGVVYFGCRDSKLYAVDAGTGMARWIFTAKGGAWMSSSPAVLNGVVYIGDGSSKEFHALDAKTGVPRFTLPMGSAMFASPSIIGDIVYVGDFLGALAAVNLSTRAAPMVFYTDSSPSRPGAPPLQTPGPELVEPQFYDYKVTRFNRNTVGSLFSSPVVVDGVLYVGSADGTLYALR